MAGEYNGGPREASPEIAAASPPRSLAQCLERGPLVLDGATGTELERRGVRSSLPLWSSHALLEAQEQVRAVHAAYVRAGARALTAATFRTQRRVLQRAGVRESPQALTERAVRLAREAAREASSEKIFVLGSAPPLEDCYRPDLTPAEPELAREHGDHARNLVRAGVDAVLAETHPSVREAVAAARAAREAGAPVLVSFVCWHGERLLSGEPLGDAIAALQPFEPLAVGVNCLPPSNVAACLPALQAAGRFLVYANLGKPDATTGFRHSEACSPETFAAHAGRWLDAGAGLVGGCCGTTPAHLAAVAQLVAQRQALGS